MPCGSSRPNGTPTIWSQDIVNGRVQGRPRLVKRDVWRMVGSVGFDRRARCITRFRPRRGRCTRRRSMRRDSTAAGPSGRRWPKARMTQSGADWSSDGTMLAYASRRMGALTGIVIRTMQSGEVRELTPSMRYIQGVTWVAGRPVHVRAGPGRGGTVRRVPHRRAHRRTLSAHRRPNLGGFTTLTVAPDGSALYYSGGAQGDATGDEVGHHPARSQDRSGAAASQVPRQRWRTLGVTRRAVPRIQRPAQADPTSPHRCGSCVPTARTRRPSTACRRAPLVRRIVVPWSGRKTGICCSSRLAPRHVALADCGQPVASPEASRSTCRPSARSGFTLTESGWRSMRASRRTKSGCMEPRSNTSRLGDAVASSQIPIADEPPDVRTHCAAVRADCLGAIGAARTLERRASCSAARSRRVLLHPERQPADGRWIELGRRLFFDRRLSADGRVSCASCHRPESRVQRRRRPIQWRPWPKRNTQRTGAHQSRLWKGILLGRPHRPASRSRCCDRSSVPTKWT